MGHFSNFFSLLLIVAFSYNFVEGSPLPSTEATLDSFAIPELEMDKKISLQKKFSSKNSMAKKAPNIPSAPLDVNENIHHTLDELNQILGSVGGAASGLVMGLTGISITDCAGSVKGKDLNTLSCQEFLNTLAECDSLSNIKPLLQQAAKNKRKNPKSKKPCFKK